MKANVSKFVARYGLGNGFDVRVITPYIRKESSMTNPLNNQSFDNKNSGLGDITIVGRYQLLSQKAGDPMFLAVGAGVKLPTGDTDKYQTLPTGISKQPGMQLGSGSTDYLMEIGATKLLPNSRVDAHILYKINSKGDNNHEFGNQINWNLGYSYALNKNFDLQLELDGEMYEKDKLNGKNVNYTGGSFVYLTPGFHYRPNNSLDVSIGYAFMIHRDNNFDSVTKTGGLSEDGVLVVRLGYNF